jgi:hypothetical protein
MFFPAMKRMPRNHDLSPPPTGLTDVTGYIQHGVGHSFSRSPNNPSAGSTNGPFALLNALTLPFTSLQYIECLALRFQTFSVLFEAPAEVAVVEEGEAAMPPHLPPTTPPFKALILMLPSQD